MSDIMMPKITVRDFDDESIQKNIDALIEISFNFPKDQVILIEVDSYGGSVLNLIRLLEHLKTMPHQICTYCSSKAMSAGLMLLMIGGTKGMRIVTPNAQLMLHEIQSMSGGDIKDMEDAMKFSKNINNIVLNLAAKSMGLKNAAAIRKMIKEKASGHDFYITAKKAKELSMVDEVGYLSMYPIRQFIMEVVKA